MKESGNAPASLALGALWVVVFVALCAVQGRVPEDGLRHASNEGFGPGRNGRLLQRRVQGGAR